jgi:hypothetical protein
MGKLLLQRALPDTLAQQFVSLIETIERFHSAKAPALLE